MSLFPVDSSPLCSSLLLQHKDKEAANAQPKCWVANLMPLFMAKKMKME